MAFCTVYSCCTNNYDDLDSTLFASNPLEEFGIERVLFTNCEEPYEKRGWKVRPLQWKHKLSPRRTARWHKVNSHLLFPESDYTVWMDANLTIKPIHVLKTLLLPHLIDNPVATFKHPGRSCVYGEAEACKRLKKDNPELINKQMKAYRVAGYPPYNGLVETACFLRRNCEEVDTLNKFWWQEINSHSFRDQLSFNYVSWKHRIPYNIVPGKREQSQFFNFRWHKRPGQ